MSLKDDIFNALSRESLSVSDLCQRFDVTRNAVVVQINQLVSAGLVAPSSARREGKVGKPATIFTAVAGHEDRGSHAYRHLSVMLVRALERSLGKKERKAFYRSMGRDEAKALPQAANETEEERVARAKAFADEMGGATEIEVMEDAYVLRSFTCPIGSVVRVDTCGCLLMASVFETLTELPTKVRCLRGERLVCQFEMRRGKKNVA